MRKIQINDIVHIGYFQSSSPERTKQALTRGRIPPGQHLALLLKDERSGHYQWWQLQESSDALQSLSESLTPILSPFASPAMACSQARKQLKKQSFRTLHCGTVYLERKAFRDEIGTPALFSHLALSYSSSNGLFLDQDYGCMARVDEPSGQALDLFKTLKKALLSNN